MRIHIKRSRRDKLERSQLLLPSVSKRFEKEHIKYEWIHQNKIPKEISDLHTLKDLDIALNKITIISYYGKDKKSGELKLPMPFDVFEFLAISYSIKWVEDKKVGETDIPSGFHGVTWSLHDCDILVKMDAYFQLSSYLTENKSFKRQDIYFDIEKDSM